VAEDLSFYSNLYEISHARAGLLNTACGAGNFGQNLVCLRARWTVIHRIKN